MDRLQPGSSIRSTRIILNREVCKASQIKIPSAGRKTWKLRHEQVLFKKDMQGTPLPLHLSYHVQQGLIVPERSNHAHHRYSEHDKAQQDEHHGRSQEKTLQGSILLPFHFSIHSHTQHTKTHQLGEREEHIVKGGVMRRIP